MFSRRLLLQLGAALPTLLTPRGAISRRAHRQDDLPPNFIHICVDDMRFDDYKYMRNVKSCLQGPGVNFTKHFVPFALCAPSRVSMLTGLQVHNHGVLKNKAPDGGYAIYQTLEDNALPVWLQQVGYYVGHVGKFINGYDEIAPDHIPPGYSDWRAMSCPFGLYRDFRLNENGVQIDYNLGEYSTDVFVQKVQEFIATAPQPYAMFFWPNACHMPALPAEQDVGSFADVDMPISPAFNEDDVGDKPRHVRNLPLMSTKTIGAIQDRWRRRQETLQSLDRGIGAIINTLNTSGQIANTHIIFTSDNGYVEGEHRIPGAKDYLYESSARAPLFWLQPSGYGEPCDHQLSNLDVTAAIVELSGAVPQRVLDGTSLVPLLSDTAAAWNKAVLIQCSKAIGIATYYYRYFEWYCGDVELYDMKADPDQLTNVGGDERYADVRTACAEALLALRGCAGSSCSWTGKFPLPPSQ